MSDLDFRSHLDRLKESCRGKEIAADLGLRRKGIRFFCPSCQTNGGKTPDFSAFDKGFKCFKCGLTGDLLDLVSLAGGMTKAAAIAYLERRTGLARPSKGYQDRPRDKIASPGSSWKAPAPSKKPDATPINRPAVANISKPVPEGVTLGLYASFLQTVCRPLEGTPGAAYLEGRGIAAEVADRYGVRYCSDLSGLWKLADRQTIKAADLSSLYVFEKAGLPFLAFPYIRQGKAVFIKTRSLLSKDEADRRELPRFLNTGGTVPCLWNHDAVAAAGEVLICEGEIDALSAIVKGFVGVGLPGWSHWKDAWTKDFAGKEVILVLDADAAGQKGSADIARRFMRAGLPCPRQMSVKHGKDLNDELRYFMQTEKAQV